MSTLTGQFYSATTGLYQADVSVVGPAGVTWTWDLADINRYVGYAVVPKQDNMAVQVLRQDVFTNNGGKPEVHLVVSVLAPPDTSGGRGGGLLNFFAVRIPELP